MKYEKTVGVVIVSGTHGIRYVIFGHYAYHHGKSENLGLPA